MAKEKIAHAKNESEVPPMKTIGVLGGMGQWSTIDILQRILHYSATKVSQYGNRGYPPMVIQMINRSCLVLNPDGSVLEPVKPAPELLEMAKVVGAKADILIMTSNTPHIFTKEVEKAAGKPLLSIVDVTIDEVKRRECKSVGIMAIGPTVRAGLYQHPLEKIGVKSILLPQELSEKLDSEGIYMVQEGENPADFTTPVIKAIKCFKDQKADGIILGCTEIPLLLENPDDPMIINPSQLLAEEVIKRALS